MYTLTLTNTVTGTTETLFTGTAVEIVEAHVASFSTLESIGARDRCLTVTREGSLTPVRVTNFDASGKITRLHPGLQG